MGHKASPSVFSWRIDFLLVMEFGYVSNYRLQRIRVIAPCFSLLLVFFFGFGVGFFYLHSSKYSLCNLGCFLFLKVTQAVHPHSVFLYTV